MYSNDQCRPSTCAEISNNTFRHPATSSVGATKTVQGSNARKSSRSNLGIELYDIIQSPGTAMIIRIFQTLQERGDIHDLEELARIHPLSRSKVGAGLFQRVHGCADSMYSGDGRHEGED